MRLEKSSIIAIIEPLIQNNGKKQLYVHRLALYIILKQYNGSCSFLLMSCYVDIYPPKWTENVFRFENIILPNNLRGVLFGIDPISRTSPY